MCMHVYVIAGVHRDQEEGIGSPGVTGGFELADEVLAIALGSSKVASSLTLNHLSSAIVADSLLFLFGNSLFVRMYMSYDLLMLRQKSLWIAVLPLSHVHVCAHGCIHPHIHSQRKALSRDLVHYTLSCVNGVFMLISWPP